jgi:putative intracellular protease/amidase
MARVLFVLTAAETLSLRDGNSISTGFWAQEFAVPWEVLAEFGCELAVATPGGRVAHPDRLCFDPRFHGGNRDRARKLWSQLDAITEWKSPLAVEDILNADTAFDALFFPGGHGPMADLAHAEEVGRLVRRFHDSARPIAAVCHGPAALLSVAEPWPFAGYRMTCFSVDDERRAGLAERLPWLLAERLDALGARVSFGAPETEHVVGDRQLLTGQNPASARQLAVRLAHALT